MFLSLSRKSQVLAANSVEGNQTILPPIQSAGGSPTRLQSRISRSNSHDTMSPSPRMYAAQLEEASPAKLTAETRQSKNAGGTLEPLIPSPSHASPKITPAMIKAARLQQQQIEMFPQVPHAFCACECGTLERCEYMIARVNTVELHVNTVEFCITPCDFMLKPEPCTTYTAGQTHASYIP